MNELLLPVTTCVNVTNTRLSERSQTHRSMYYMIPLILSSETSLKSMVSEVRTVVLFGKE